MAGAVRQNGRHTSRFVLTCSRFVFLLLLTLLFHTWLSLKPLSKCSLFYAFVYIFMQTLHIRRSMQYLLPGFFPFSFEDEKKIILHSFFQLSTPHIYDRCLLSWLRFFARRRLCIAYLCCCCCLLHINSSNIDISNNATPLPHPEVASVCWRVRIYLTSHYLVIIFFLNNWRCLHMKLWYVLCVCACMQTTTQLRHDACSTCTHTHLTQKRKRKKLSGVCDNPMCLHVHAQFYFPHFSSLARAHFLKPIPTTPT